jgi:hypothetical protein
MSQKQKPEEQEEETISDEKESKGTIASLVTSPQVKVTAGVVAAGAGGIIAAGLIGAAPLAIAGAAGYLAYKGMTGQRV